MEPILALAQRHGLRLIEDVAQAFFAETDLGRCGTLGELGCFSLQQGKHMTTGEGGIVVTDDDELARRVFLFVNKAWGYGDANPDHTFPALNYRMTELQGAVALAQLDKVEWVVERRRAVAAMLGEALAGIDGLELPAAPPGTAHAWWKYAFLVDETVLAGGAAELGRRMKARGVSCVPRYIQKPAFECALFRDWRDHAVTRVPFERFAAGRAGPLFDRRDHPGAFRALERVIVLPINELYLPEHVRFVADVIHSEADALRRGGATARTTAPPTKR
jgi:dTDP-4-amino-4,6-dideoxygalactose transaminase